MSVRPAKTQINLDIRPVWSESSLGAQWVAKDPSFLHADSEDSDQTGWMPRLIWVFAGRTAILLVLSCRGSHIFHEQENETLNKWIVWLRFTQHATLPPVSSTGDLGRTGTEPRTQQMTTGQRPVPPVGVEPKTRLAAGREVDQKSLTVKQWPERMLHRNHRKVLVMLMLGVGAFVLSMENIWHF